MRRNAEQHIVFFLSRNFSQNTWSVVTENDYESIIKIGDIMIRRFEDQEYDIQKRLKENPSVLIFSEEKVKHPKPQMKKVTLPTLQNDKS